MSSGGMMSYAMAAEASDTSPPSLRSPGRSRYPPSIPPGPCRPWNSTVSTIRSSPSKGPPTRTQTHPVGAGGLNQWVKADGCSTTPHKAKTIVGATGSTSAGQTATLVTYNQLPIGAPKWPSGASPDQVMVWPGSSINTGGAVGRGMTSCTPTRRCGNSFKRYSLPKSAPDHDVSVRRL